MSIRYKLTEDPDGDKVVVSLENIVSVVQMHDPTGIKPASTIFYQHMSIKVGHTAAEVYEWLGGKSNGREH